jgi:glycosyltransferase involved in cell wall biosynthesis
LSSPTTVPSRLKICYVLGSLQYGGAEGQVLELIKGLDRERFEPFLILERGDDCQRSDGLGTRVGILHSDSRSINSTPKRVYYGARSFLRFYSYLSEFNPDVIHAFLPVPCILSSIARLLGKTQCVVASRRSLVDCYRPHQRLGSLADILATRAADLVLGNSEAVVREVIALDHVSPSRARLIYNGVDTDRFSPLRSTSLRDELGWDREHVVVGIVANFIPYKRHCDFVSAAALINAAAPNTRFLLVGADLGEMRSVQQSIQDAGLADYVKILGNVTTSELAFAAMDLYVCSSDTEGFSNVVLEAMATGLPVIATDVGGNREALGAANCGLLVPPRSPDLLAQAVLELVQAPAQRRRFSENARTRAVSVFSIDAMVRAHEHIYTRLAAEKPESAWARLW